MSLHEHVRVPDAVGGRGLAGQLTRHALDWARDEGLKVRPVCPYVATWIERHPDYQGLVDLISLPPLIPEKTSPSPSEHLTQPPLQACRPTHQSGPR
jgi:hypothetical protein